MITQQDKEGQARQKLEAGIRLCEEAIAKSEKYERLKDNKDWQGYIEDLRILSTVHDREIKMAEEVMVDAPNAGYLKMEMDHQTYVSSKKDWMDFIIVHQVQKIECLKWIKEPERILVLASQARERLPKFQEKLEELNNGVVAGNGKP